MTNGQNLKINNTKVGIQDKNHSKSEKKMQGG